MKKDIYKICSDRILWRNIDKEVVILDLENDNYYGLNAVGSRVWELLGKGNSLKDISIVVAEEYNVSLKKAQKDIEAIIGKLKKEKLIKDK